MQLPTIHLNGTPKRMLVDALCAASHALDAAYEALRQTGPNGRDYYPQGPGALQKAEAEHFDRMRRLDQIKTEIDQLTIAIDEIAEGRMHWCEPCRSYHVRPTDVAHWQALQCRAPCPFPEGQP